MSSSQKRSKIYTNAQILRALLVLRDNFGNVQRTAKKTGIPANTLSGWKHGTGSRIAALKRQLEARGASDVEEMRARLGEVERELGELKAWRAELTRQLETLRAGS
ncbi:MAG TPA: hypothetical protein VK363_19245 [Pyrinomonadaceae bacterium]|nr:hypothetical protein [Pyrinomonadaceae bacterium]